MSTPMKDTLLHRPPNGGGAWKVVFVQLVGLGEEEGPKLQITDEDDGSKGLGEFIQLDPTCSVFETNLGPHAFEVVTTKKILHFIAESCEMMSKWMDTLLKVISTTKLNLNDSFLLSIAERIDKDVEYEVQFLESKPLGIVLERSNQNAIVKISNFKESGVEAGSVLVKINGVSVESRTYQETIAALKQWNPPLRLGFMKSPSKRGFLKKYTKDKSKSGSRVWRNRFFCLEAGHLQYRETQQTSMKGDIPLMGASVSILVEPGFGAQCCFRILSGVTVIILQAEDYDSMMDWVTKLYHAIAMANGAKYLPQLQAIRTNSAAEENTEQEAIRPLPKKSLKSDQSPSCVHELRSFEEFTSSVGDNFIEEGGENTSDAMSADQDKENAESSDNSIEINPSHIIFDDYFMKSIDANSLTNDIEVQNREILDLLNNAINLGFKSELIFAVHLAEKANFDNETHESYEIYMRASRMIGDVFRVQQQENFGDDDDAPEKNFIIRQDVSMDLSDDGIIVDNDSSLMECFGSNMSIDQNNSLMCSDMSNNADDVHETALSIEEREVKERDPSVEEQEAIKLAKRSSRNYKLNSNVPATNEDLKELFRIFTNQMECSGFINPIHLSTIWRIVTGEKGNLFKEMQLFSKFDVENDGFLHEKNFVEGWFAIAREMDSLTLYEKDAHVQKKGHDLLCKLKSIVEERGCESRMSLVD